jgi:hypothetical protein
MKPEDAAPDTPDTPGHWEENEQRARHIWDEVYIRMIVQEFVEWDRLESDQALDRTFDRASPEDVAANRATSAVEKFWECMRSKEATCQKKR